MIKVIKKTKGAHGNRLEFYQADHIKNNIHIVVQDKDCQLERIYFIGATQELDNFEKVEIKSIDQVIKAWETGKVWF